jgi:hypothetical protein
MLKGLRRAFAYGTVSFVSIWMAGAVFFLPNVSLVGNWAKNLEGYLVSVKLECRKELPNESFI